MINPEIRHERSQHDELDDPVLMMLGVGKRLWERESGDSFVDRLRSDALPDPPVSQPPNS